LEGNVDKTLPRTVHVRSRPSPFRFRNFRARASVAGDYTVTGRNRSILKPSNRARGSTTVETERTERVQQQLPLSVRDAAGRVQTVMAASLVQTKIRRGPDDHDEDNKNVTTRRQRRHVRSNRIGRFNPFDGRFAYLIYFRRRLRPKSNSRAHTRRIIRLRTRGTAKVMFVTSHVCVMCECRTIPFRWLEKRPNDTRGGQIERTIFVRRTRV